MTILNSLVWKYHRIVFAVMFCLCCLIGMSDADTYYSKSYAIVIGIDNYPEPAFPDLPFAKKDAFHIGNYLKTQGFTVKELYNKNAKKFNIISEINSIAKQLNKNDRVLVFFSGHGHSEVFSDEIYGYIVPYDGTKNSASLISMEKLRELSLKLGNAKHQMFILDACFGGLIATKDTLVYENTPPKGYLDFITKNEARQFLTAGGKNQKVRAAGPKGYSYFTGYLLEGLAEGKADLYPDGYITFPELYVYLMGRASNDNQNPISGVFQRHGEGENVFKSPNEPLIDASEKPDSYDGPFKGSASLLKGILRVVSDTTGSLYLNEKYYDYLTAGIKKEYMNIAEGTYKVMFWSGDNRKITKDVQVQGGKISPVSFVLEQTFDEARTGTIRIISLGKLKIYIDDEFAGEVEENGSGDFMKSIGEHNVEIHSDYRTITRSVMVKKDEVNVIDLTLTSPPWGLTVE